MTVEQAWPLDEVRGHRIFVWHSTSESVKGNTFSVLALAEVLISVGAYWALAVWLQSQTHLWVSIIVAPLLLLRSEPSTALGVKWFDNYVDASPLTPKQVMASPVFWVASVAASLSTALVAYALSKTFLSGHESWATVLLGCVVGYLAIQAGLAIETAVAGHEVATVSAERMILATLAAGGWSAMAVGIITAGAGNVTVIAVLLTTTVLLAIGVVKVPPITASAITARNESDVEARSRGVTFGRASLAKGPLVLAPHAPAILLGGWLRSVAVRMLATACHPWAGMKAMPSNWWRTLFVIDTSYPPELVPGYKRKDMVNVSHFYRELKNITHPLQRYIYSVAFIMLFAPAYFYRLSIKSTCWFYLPLAYMARPAFLSIDPELLRDLLLRDPREWWRRLLAVLTVAGVIISTLPSTRGLAAELPTIIISPLEYIFLIDLSSIKPWQWFNLASATITLALFAFMGRFTIFLSHSAKNEALARIVNRYALWFEHGMRFRNVSTTIFLLIAFVHALLWLSPLQDHLPTYILDLLRTLYGSSMPPRQML